MQLLVSRLETIQQETGEGQKAQAAVKGGDEFLRLKKQIAANVKDIRAKLAERDELLSKGASGTKATVQTSHVIRQQLKQAREDANKLMALQRKEAAKTRGKEKEADGRDIKQVPIRVCHPHTQLLAEA